MHFKKPRNFRLRGFFATVQLDNISQTRLEFAILVRSFFCSV